MNRLSGTNHCETMNYCCATSRCCVTIEPTNLMSCYATEMTVTKTIDCCWSLTAIVMTAEYWTTEFDCCCCYFATNVKSLVV